jgi:hypothetical protein
MPKTPAQLDREIAENLGRPRLALSCQRLLFIKFAPANTFRGVRAVPVPVDFREQDVARVWTLYNETDERHPPTLPFSPNHHNAFVENRNHDWSIVAGKFRYGSRAMDHDVWLLVEMK